MIHYSKYCNGYFIENNTERIKYEDMDKSNWNISRHIYENRL